jgi:hypothetical protein
MMIDAGIAFLLSWVVCWDGWSDGGAGAFVDTAAGTAICFGDCFVFGFDVGRFNGRIAAEDPSFDFNDAAVDRAATFGFAGTTPEVAALV